MVIKKGGGNRPYEALATLASLQEGAKFYPYPEFVSGPQGGKNQN